MAENEPRQTTRTGDLGWGPGITFLALVGLVFAIDVVSMKLQSRSTNATFSHVGTTRR